MKPCAIELRRSIHIDAPVDDVFAYFTQFQSFPRFLNHVRDVQPAGEGRWQWTVDGPAGVPVSWTPR